MAKSYDWDMGYGLVVFNPKGFKKYGLNMDPTEDPVKWTCPAPHPTRESRRSPAPTAAAQRVQQPRPLPRVQCFSSCCWPRAQPSVKPDDKREATFEHSNSCFPGDTMMK